MTRNPAFRFMAIASIASCGGGHDGGSGGGAPVGTLPGTRSTPLALDPARPGTVAIDPNSLVLDNAGVATLLWGNQAGVWTTRFSASSGWNPATSLTTQGSPTLVLDGDGNASVVWWTQTQGSPPLSMIGGSRYASGSGWTSIPGFSDGNIDYAPGSGVGAGGRGQLALLGAISTSGPTPTTQTNVHSFDPKTGWSVHSLQGPSSPAVAVMSDGTVMVAWAVAAYTDSPPSSVCMMSFSMLPPGGSWTAPAVFDGSTCTRPALLADHRGSLVAFYETQGVAPYAKDGSLVFRWFRQGAWTSPQTVATPGWSQAPPTAMGGGIAIVSLSATSFVEVTPATQQPFDLPSISEPLLGSGVQKIVMDATGRAVVVWDVVRSGGQANEGYYRRFDPSSGWTAPTQVTVSGGAGAYLGPVAIATVDRDHCPN